MKTKYWLFLISGLFASNAMAVIPVVDWSAIIQAGNELRQLQQQYKMLEDTYNNAKNQYETLRNTYDNAKNQLATVKSLRDFNKGKYGWGELANKLKDLKERQWSPSTWEDALKNISGGNPARYKALASKYKEKNKDLLSDTEFAKGASKEKLDNYKKSKEVHRAASIQSTYAFNDINKHLQNVHDISSKIEKAENTKSAIDLNSRLLAEIAYLQTQNLKMQALQNQQTAHSLSQELSSQSESAAFNKIPDYRK